MKTKQDIFKALTGEPKRPKSNPHGTPIKKPNDKDQMADLISKLKSKKQNQS